MYAQSSAKPIITCRGLVNDTYKMDLILIYPPYMIALACIYIASALKDKDTTSWFEELRVDMNIVSFCIDHFPSIDSVSISLTSPIIFFLSVTLRLRISQWKFWISMTPTRSILKEASQTIRLALC